MVGKIEYYFSLLEVEIKPYRIAYYIERRRAEVCGPEIVPGVH